MARDLSPNLPEKVVVVYPVRRCAGNPDDGTPKTYTSTVKLADVTFTDDLIDPQPLGTSGTTHAVRSTALALYDAPGGPPSNKAELDALAGQLGQDFYDWRSESYDIAYNGICAVAPNGLIDLIEFRYDQEDQATRVQTQPWRGEPEEFQHQDPAVADCKQDDRNPGVLMDIPGGTAGMQGVLSLEAGLLVMTYDNSTAPNCGCTTSDCSFTVLVNGCGNAALPVAGDPITVKDSKGNVVFQGDTGADGKLVVTVPASGTYTASRDDSCGGTGETGSVTVTCPSTTQTLTLRTNYQATLTLLGCNGAPGYVAYGTYPIVTVTATATGQVVGTFGCNPNSGVCTICVPWVGSYTYSIQGGGGCYQDEGPIAFTVAGCTTDIGTHTLIPILYNYLIQVFGCSAATAPLPCGEGVTVVYSAPGNTQTLTTDACGQVTVTNVRLDCAYTVTISHPRFQTYTISAPSPTCAPPLIAIPGCPSYNFNIQFQAVAAGYMCLQCIWYPVATTIHITDVNGTLSTSPDGTPVCYLAPARQVAECYNSQCMTDFQDPGNPNPTGATTFTQGQPSLSYTLSADCAFGGSYSDCLNPNDGTTPLALGTCGGFAGSCGTVAQLIVSLVTGAPPVPPFSMHWNVTSGPAPGDVLIGE